MKSNDSCKTHFVVMGSAVCGTRKWSAATDSLKAFTAEDTEHRCSKCEPFVAKLIAKKKAAQGN